MQNISRQNEEVVSQYFSKHGGMVVKLDRPGRRNSSASDWHVVYPEFEFLCELKTIMSVRASMPYSSPVDRLVEERDRKKAEIEQWIAEHPGQRLVMGREEYEDLSMPELDFRGKYAKRRRFTDADFNQNFSVKMLEFFHASHANLLPYILDIHSHDMYIPGVKERETFFSWLETELVKIAEGQPSSSWFPVPPEVVGYTYYMTDYTLHEPIGEGDIRSNLSVTVSPSKRFDRLIINFYTDGGLNLETIDRNIDGARDQLNESAQRQEDRNIARLIVLAFVDHLSFERFQLVKHIGSVLKKYHDLSAIAILEQVPNPEQIQHKEYSNPVDWIIAHIGVPLVPHFSVFHNPLANQVNPLDPRAFDSPSKQFHDFSYLSFPDL